MTDTDPRPQLGTALDQMQALIATTPADAAGLPTPCADFDVEHLIGHLLAVVQRIGVVLDGRPPLSVPSMLQSSDWIGDWTALRAGTDRVLTDDGCLTREVKVPWGAATGASAIGGYIAELTTHSWDLAAATARIDQLDSDLARRALVDYRSRLPASPRANGVIPFGEVVELPDDASDYQRLVAWTGRDPYWTA